jgi:hypothetical protein
MRSSRPSLISLAENVADYELIDTLSKLDDAQQYRMDVGSIDRMADLLRRIPTVAMAVCDVGIANQLQLILAHEFRQPKQYLQVRVLYNAPLAAGIALPLDDLVWTDLCRATIAEILASKEPQTVQSLAESATRVRQLGMEWTAKAA